LHEVDLLSPSSIADLVEAVQGHGFDGLINNAGIALGGSFASMEYRQIETIFNTNLMAAIQLTHRLLPGLLEKRAGFIINIASGAGLLAPGGMAVYAASKFALVGFSESLRAELKGSGIGVSVVCPPFVRTGIVRNSQGAATGLTAEEIERLERLDRLVQQHGISPEGVAQAVVRAIRGNRARVMIGLKMRLLIALRFFFPGLAII